MERRIITVLDKLETDNKQRILVSKKDRAFLFDKENPYYWARNEEKKKSIFVLFGRGHYGILRSNILSIIEDKASNFVGGIFRSIKGITDDEFNESYFIHLLGKDGKKTWVKAKKIIFSRNAIENENEEGDELPEVRVEARPSRSNIYINTAEDEAANISGMSVSYSPTSWAASDEIATTSSAQAESPTLAQIDEQREREREERLAREYTAAAAQTAGLTS